MCINFEIGDFVLSGQVIKHANKLVLCWKGPYRAVSTLNDWVYKIQELVEPYDVHTRHTSRLRFHKERYLDVTQILKDHIVFANGGHLVKRFLECRMNRATQTWEILVKWIGLVADNSWKPAVMMHEHVPVLLSQWVKDNPGAKEMWRSIEGDAQRKKGK